MRKIGYSTGKAPSVEAAKEGMRIGKLLEKGESKKRTSSTGYMPRSLKANAKKDVGGAHERGEGGRNYSANQAELRHREVGLDGFKARQANKEANKKTRHAI